MAATPSRETSPGRCADRLAGALVRGGWWRRAAAVAPSILAAIYLLSWRASQSGDVE